MRLPLIPKGLLRIDTVVVNRTPLGTDVNGVNVGALVLVPAITAALYAAPTASDLAEAGQRATKVDAVLAFVNGTDIRADDRVTVRGATYEVVTVEDSRNRIRAHIRKISPP